MGLFPWNLSLDSPGLPEMHWTVRATVCSMSEVFCSSAVCPHEKGPKGSDLQWFFIC